MKNTLKSRSTKCFANIYHYVQQNTFQQNLDLSCVKVKLFADIVSFSYTKNIAQPSGQFEITLVASKDYRLICPGDWIQIWLTTGSGNLSNIGDLNKRVIGNIDRVAINDQVNPDGTRSTTFQISGRDWGKVLESTSIFFNPYTIAATAGYVINKLNKPRGSPEVLIKSIMNVFFNNRESIPDQGVGKNYWYLPSVLLQDLGGGSDSIQFIDILDMKDLDVQYPGYKYMPMINGVQQVWPLLKGISNQPIYELFCELTDDEVAKPKLYFRTRPYAFRNLKTAKVPIQYFLDLPAVSITDEDIISASVGTCDHERTNLMFVELNEQPNIGQQQVNTYVDLPDTVMDRASIQKNGLRVTTRSVDYGLVDQNNNVDPNVYSEYVTLLSNWHLNNHLLENGSFTIIGNPSVKIGKRLEVKNSRMYNNNNYYIEGYTDSWTFGGMWTQTLQVTRGIKVVDNKEYFIYSTGANSELKSDYTFDLPTTQYITKNKDYSGR